MTPEIHGLPKKLPKQHGDLHILPADWLAQTLNKLIIWSLKITL